MTNARGMQARGLTAGVAVVCVSLASAPRVRADVPDPEPATAPADAEASQAAPEEPQVLVDGVPQPRVRRQPGPATERDPFPIRPATAEPGPEIGLGAGQLLLGSMTMALTLFPIGAMAVTGSEAGAVGALLFAPIAGGFVVCGIGGTSRYYDGSCGGPLLGAYLGALTSIPFALIGCSLAPSRGDLNGCGEGAVLGFLSGYLVGTAIGATVAWHLGKRPRAPRARHALQVPPPALAPSRSSTPTADLHVTVPLLAFAF